MSTVTIPSRQSISLQPSQRGETPRKVNNLRPIYKIWAEKVKNGLTIMAFSKGSPRWEHLDEQWVQDNFASYTSFLQGLHTNGGHARIVPKGRSVGVVVPLKEVSTHCGGIAAMLLRRVPSSSLEQRPYCQLLVTQFSSKRRMNFQDRYILIQEKDFITHNLRRKKFVITKN
eukprot:Lithocolla_globosa_v1_NODE_8740_length_787_cov_4.945355.p1 type:complete len:172 gc:universal NODE_8740_length_787_cov_4.945355:1-516(+)